MLPHVIRFNGAEFGNWYRDLLEGTGGANGFPDPASGFEGLADFVSQMALQAGLPSRLSDCGVEEAKLPALGGRSGQAVDRQLQSA